MIIDLHSHLLPGVDDGARTYENSIELARLAVSEGIEHLVLTPHHRNNQYLNRSDDVVEATEKLRAVYREHQIPLKVYAAQEIRLTEYFLDDIYNQDLLSLDGTGKYYLIEFPTASVPSFSLSLMEEIVSLGITPIIAHPERNHVFAKNLNELHQFIELGCLGQLTSTSLMGGFGEEIQKVSQQMIESNLVHVIASDVHHIKHRPFNMKAVYAYVNEEFGSEEVRYYQDNARDIINGDAVNVRKPKVQKKKLRWFEFFRR